MLNRFGLAWNVFWSMLLGKSLNVAQFQMLLDTMPGQPMAKKVQETRKYTAIQFIVKLYKPVNKKTRRKSAWGV